MLSWVPQSIPAVGFGAYGFKVQGLGPMDYAKGSYLVTDAYFVKNLAGAFLYNVPCPVLKSKSWPITGSQKGRSAKIGYPGSREVPYYRSVGYGSQSAAVG